MLLSILLTGFVTHRNFAAINIVPCPLDNFDGIKMDITI